MINKLPTKAMIERLCVEYPAGTRVRLLRMDDPFTLLKPGNLGTIEFWDDCGTAHCIWDCGSRLGVLIDIDQIEKVGINND